MEIADYKKLEEEIYSCHDKRENGSGDKDYGLMDKTHSTCTTSDSLGNSKKDAYLLVGSESDECPQ